MNKTIYIVPVLAALLMAGCSKDNPFEGESAGEGQVLRTALDLSKAGGDVQIETRSGEEDVDVQNFQVSFLRNGSTQAFRTYDRYGDMPEVVTLPADSYKVMATYGEDRNAEWENPYYKGESESFDVQAGEITSYIAPVVCELQNVKVTIEFDPALQRAMSDDSYVEVKVGNVGSLRYTPAETNIGKAGYFKYTAENTLVATFYGTIDDGKVVATKSYDNVKGGCWYKLTFKLHSGSGDGSGDASGTVKVDAEVDVDDVNADVTIEEDKPMDDSDRPTWGDGDEPGPGPEKEGPQIQPTTPGLVFDEIWHATASSECEFKITSSAEGGIQELTCDIISTSLNADELKNVGLNSHLDLVNTTAQGLDGALGNLGFPVNVGGQKVVNFSITGFMSMLALFPEEVHEFRLHVKDANGEVTKSLKIYIE